MAYFERVSVLGNTFSKTIDAVPFVTPLKIISGETRLITGSSSIPYLYGIAKSIPVAGYASGAIVDGALSLYKDGAVVDPFLDPSSAYVNFGPTFVQVRSSAFGAAQSIKISRVNQTLAGNVNFPLTNTNFSDNSYSPDLVTLNAFQGETFSYFPVVAAYPLSLGTILVPGGIGFEDQIISASINSDAMGWTVHNAFNFDGTESVDSFVVQYNDVGQGHYMFYDGDAERVSLIEYTQSALDPGGATVQANFRLDFGATINDIIAADGATVTNGYPGHFIVALHGAGQGIFLDVSDDGLHYDIWQFDGTAWNFTDPSQPFDFVLDDTGALTAVGYRAGDTYLILAEMPIVATWNDNVSHKWPITPLIAGGGPNIGRGGNPDGSNQPQMSSGLVDLLTLGIRNQR